MKRLAPALIVLLCVPACVYVVRHARARARIEAAKAEVARTPLWIFPRKAASDPGFDLRHPPFGIFGNPPPEDVERMLEMLRRFRIGSSLGLKGRFTWMAEERRFTARLASMRRLGQITPEDDRRLRAALQTAPPRPDFAESFRTERIFLIEEILRLRPMEAYADLPTRGVPPQARDWWSEDLLLARALDDLDALYEGLPHGRAELPPDSPLSPWIQTTALAALHYDAQIQAEFDSLLAETPP